MMFAVAAISINDRDSPQQVIMLGYPLSGKYKGRMDDAPMHHRTSKFGITTPKCKETHFVYRHGILP